jgi:3-oxoacyl-(acyl-carrier-protein) synthase
MRVFITGTGMVSAIGNDVTDTFQSLCQGTSGIRLVENEGLSSHPIMAGIVPLENDELLSELRIPGDGNIPRTALLAIKAAREALKNDHLTGRDLGFFNGTTTGGMDLTEQFFKSYITQSDLSGFLKTRLHDLGKMSFFVANSVCTPIYVDTLSTACSSAANSILLGMKYIRSGRIDRALVGGSDALLALTVSGFKSLMIYDEERCKPFSTNRNGLNLGEGAAYLLLENESSIKKSNNTILAELTGGWNANDHYHATASSPDGRGALKAMKGALKDSNTDPSDLDYINAHGTGTVNNDQSELNALQRLLSGIEIPFSSTKGFTGHTLGAAGALEAVVSVISIQEGFMPANLSDESLLDNGFMHPIGETKKDVLVNTVMSNSFGFGGNCTSLIFKKHA